MVEGLRLTFPFSLAEIEQMKLELIKQGVLRQDVEGLRISITDPWGSALIFQMPARYPHPNLVEFYTLRTKKFDGAVRYLYIDGWFTKDQLRPAYIWHLAHEIAHHLGKSEREAEEYAAQFLGSKPVLVGGIKESKIIGKGGNAGQDDKALYFGEKEKLASRMIGGEGEDKGG